MVIKKNLKWRHNNGSMTLIFGMKKCGIDIQFLIFYLFWNLYKAYLGILDLEFLHQAET